MELILIGIGTGNPEHLTLQAIRALNSADLILIPDKGADKADLGDLRRAICDEVLTNAATRIASFRMPVRDAANPSYLAGVNAWHDAIAERWAEAIAAHEGAAGQGADGRGADGQGARVALLVWGDPALYDSTLRIAARLQGRIAGGVQVRVIPGLMSPQVLTAAHGIALNDLGAPFAITTGRRLREDGWPAGIDTVIVMLDGEAGFAALPPEGISVWWGAYVGMAHEILDHGPLAEAGPRILAARAAARARHGWIMDICLLRRGRAPDAAAIV